MASPSLYQPSPRFGHCAAQVGEKSYLWGGITQDFPLGSRQTLASEIEIFDVFSETWKTRTATGAPPPGLYLGACTVVSETLYHFGGHDNRSRYNTLHSLDTLSLDWRELHGHAQNPADQPMPKTACGLVTYTDTASLALFAGFGIPSGPTQPGAGFVPSTNFTDGRGWTNEFHLFNLTNGEWSSPPTTGPRPPPCAGFSFTAINHHMAVMFGGYHCTQGGRQFVNDVYIIDFRSMEWTKLERPEGAPWPVERTRHAACCLSYGDVHPQLLVTGGVDKDYKTLSDAWLLDINTGRWRELTLPEGTQARFGHTLTACRMCPGRIHATTFGGCPYYVFGQLDDAQPKIAETTVMEFESIESDDGPHSSKWVLVGMVGSSGLGTPERLTKLENLKQRRTEQVPADPIPDPWMTFGFPTQLQPTLPTFQYHLTQFPVPQTAQTLQPQFSSGGIQEMQPEELPLIPPINFPYHAQSLLPLPAILPTEVQPVISSTTAEASTAAVPFHQPSALSGLFDALLTTASATSPQVKHSDTSQHQSPLLKGESQTAHTKLEQLSPKEKKPSLSDIKPKMELSPKKESRGIKTEPKEEVEENVKLKQVFSVSDVDKGDLVEELAAKNKLLLDMISQLKEQIAEKDNVIDGRNNEIAERDQKIDERDKQIAEQAKQIVEKDKLIAEKDRLVTKQAKQIVKKGEQIAEKNQQIAEQVNQIAEKDQKIAKKGEQIAEKDKQIAKKNKYIVEQAEQIAERDEQRVKHQLMYERLLKDVDKPAGVIAGKRKQLEASEQGVVLKKIHLSDEASGERAVLETEVGSEANPGIGEINTSLKVQIKTLEAEIEELKRRLDQKKSKTNYNSLLGVEVVGEEEVVVTNEALDFHWKDYGFKLHIPENALPEGTLEYHVNIKASLSGQFELPDGYELVSAVYWVATPGKFTKAVILEAQHCANFSNPSQLCFVRTSCTQKSLPYKFKIIEGGSFACGSKHGVLSAPHFSGNGIAKEVTQGEHSCQYCAQVYFTVKHLQDYWYCHFVITKNLEMCLMVVKRKYQQEYDIAPPITFAGDHVALDIPDDGTQTNNGWEIVPLHKADIEKARVDNFSSEKSWVPECVLLLKWLQKDRSPDPLEYKVKLLGTRKENDFFRIFHHPAATLQMNQPATVEELQVKLVVPLLKDLVLVQVAEWYDLGLQLGVEDEELDVIKKNNPGNLRACKREMFRKWLRITANPSYQQLVEALTAVGDVKEADQLSKKYAFLGTTNYTKQSKSRGKKQNPKDVVVNCNVNCRRKVGRTMDGGGRKKTGGEDST